MKNQITLFWGVLQSNHFFVGIIRIETRLKKIVGPVKLPKDFDEEKELHTYFENRINKNIL
ncbi:MAG: hypothetical protein ABIR03_05345 [Ginsengibacter sp.]